MIYLSDVWITRIDIASYYRGVARFRIKVEKSLPYSIKWLRYAVHEIKDLLRGNIVNSR